MRRNTVFLIATGVIFCRIILLIVRFMVRCTETIPAQ